MPAPPPVAYAPPPNPSRGGSPKQRPPRSTREPTHRSHSNCLPGFVRWSCCSRLCVRDWGVFCSDKGITKVLFAASVAFRSPTLATPPMRHEGVGISCIDSVLIFLHIDKRDRFRGVRVGLQEYWVSRIDWAFFGHPAGRVGAQHTQGVHGHLHGGVLYGRVVESQRRSKYKENDFHCDECCLLVEFMNRPCTRTEK